jgi:predicted TPR repeat methyltransferase
MAGLARPFSFQQGVRPPFPPARRRHNGVIMSASFRTSGDLLADRRYAYGAAAAKEGDHEAAADLFAQTLEIVPDWAPAAIALGDAKLASGEPDAARALYERTLSLDPEDVLGARARLARLGAVPPDRALSDGYVRGLFDDYADRFDAHLLGSLGYRAPDLILGALPPGRFARALDLGCGTGLMGRAVRDRVDTLVGCDLSPAMIEKAREKQFYDHLAVADLVTFLDGEAEASADLVLAADVFVYVGDLAPVFAAARRVIDPTGFFVFTVQSHSGAGFVVGDDLRTAHSEAWLMSVAARTGFRVERLDEVSARHDAGRPVPGFLLSLRPA